MPKTPKHLKTKIAALDQVLGGGFVPGNVYLIGGPRGVGKTSLLLQACRGIESLYATGEMHQKSLVEFARRVGCADVGLFGDPDGLDILEVIEEARKTKLLVVDSIQYALLTDIRKADIGSPAMIRAATRVLVKFAHENEVAVVVVTHMTKKGEHALYADVEDMFDTHLRLDSATVWENGEAVKGTEGLRKISVEWSKGKPVKQSKGKPVKKLLTFSEARSSFGFRTPSADLVKKYEKLL